MKKQALLLILIITTNLSFGQHISHQYFNLVKKADSLYNENNYINSAFTYSEAFIANDWKVIPNDRFKAACSWALANYPDSAFHHLNSLVTLNNYTNFKRIVTSSDLKSLRKDPRWTSLIKRIKINKDKAKSQLVKPLVKQLGRIFVDDQKYRLQISTIEKKYGSDSKKMKNHWNKIKKMILLI